MAETPVDALLIGGGVASVRCARMLRREGFDGRIVIVGAEERAPYNRPPLSKELLRDDLSDDLVAAEGPSWYERRGVELLLGDPVAELDVDRHEARTAAGRTLPFQRALVATGAEARRPPIPGADLVLTLRSLDDARRIRAAAVSAGRGANAVIIGGGFIGVEVASGLASLGMRVTVVELAPRLWGGALGDALSAWGVDRLASAGIDVRLGAAVAAVEDGAVRVGDEAIDARVVVAGVGVAPRVDLATAAGLEVEDGVVVDDGQRTSRPDVWAAGDVARRRDHRRVEHWHAARESGDRAARSMLGLEPQAHPPPWVFSEVAGVALDVVGETAAFDDERWLDDGATALAYSRDGSVVGMAVIAGRIDPQQARGWVAERLRVEEVERLLA